MFLRHPVRQFAVTGLLVLGLAVSAVAAQAAEVIYPPSARFGFTPLPNMVQSKRFTGFERPDGGAIVTIVELPGGSYAEVEKSFTEENLKSQGFTLHKREAIKVNDGIDATLFSGELPVPESAGATAVSPTVRKWILLVDAPDVTGIVIAQQVPGAEPDDAMRTMLTGLRIRPALTLDEQVEALPFRIGTLAAFRPVRVLAGNSVLLTNGPKDVIVNLEQPVLVLAQAVQQPPGAEQREAFGRAALYSNQTMKDFIIERAQSYRHNGADWHEIVARAVDIPTNLPVVVSQTIRFNPDGYLRALGVVRAENRDQTLSAFRDVIDSVQVK